MSTALDGLSVEQTSRWYRQSLQACAGRGEWRTAVKLLSQLKAETTPAIRATLHAQLVQHCHLLALPVPALDSVGRATPQTDDLFPAK